MISLQSMAASWQLRKRLLLGAGFILCQSCCYVTTIMIVTYIWNLFSIKHFWLHSLVKFWASIANIKRMRVLQILDTLEIKPNLNNSLTWISQLEVWIVCQYVCDAQKHALKVKPWEMSLALYGPNVSDDKNGYFRGRSNLESIMLLWLPISRW